MEVFPCPPSQTPQGMAICSTVFETFCFCYVLCQEPPHRHLDNICRGNCHTYYDIVSLCRVKRTIMLPSRFTGVLQVFPILLNAPKIPAALLVLKHFTEIKKKHPSYQVYKACLLIELYRRDQSSIRHL